MVPRNGHRGGRREKKELQGYQSSLGSDGFENQFRVGALGADAFELGPVMIRKIHAYLVKEVNLAESAEEKAAEFVNRHILFLLRFFGQVHPGNLLDSEGEGGRRL